MSQLLKRKFVPELLILLAVIAVFGQTVGFDFISYDDTVYVYENENITSGVSLKNSLWALTATEKINLWHPLTWFSHQLDSTIYGVEKPGGHHATNTLVHALTAILCFWLLRRVTGSPLIALMATLLFAIHPQRVQSVAWISERKDVLSGFFSLGAMLAFLKYHSETTSRSQSRFYYISSLFLLTLALASKPIAIVVPAALALIVFVKRSKNEPRPLVKQMTPLLPLFALAGTVALLTTWIQAGGGLGDLSNQFPLSRRLLQIPHGILFYLRTLVFPFPGNLWVYPPSGADLSPFKVGLITLLPAILGVLIWKLGRSQKMLLIGIGWAILFWIPVSGIVPVSFYYVADRYTYLPHIGALLALVYLGGVVLRRLNLSQWAPLVGTLLIIATSVISFQQTAKWKDSETLFSHEMKINPRSLLAPVHLGDVYLSRDNPAAALPLFEKAVSLDPKAAIAHVNLGKTLSKLGRTDEAIASLSLATETKPPLASAYRHLGIVHAEAGNYEKAIERLNQGIGIFPNNADLQVDLGTLLGFNLKRSAEAIEIYDQVLETHPNDVIALQGAGVLRLQNGGDQLGKGIEQLELLLRLQPHRDEIRKVVEQAKAQLIATQ